MTATSDTQIEQVFTPAAPLRMSYEEYLHWEHEGSLAEIVGVDQLVAGLRGE